MKKQRWGNQFYFNLLDVIFFFFCEKKDKNITFIVPKIISSM